MYALGLYGCLFPYGAGLKYKGDPRHILFSSGKLSTGGEKGETFGLAYTLIKKKYIFFFQGKKTYLTSVVVPLAV